MFGRNDCSDRTKGCFISSVEFHFPTDCSFNHSIFKLFFQSVELAQAQNTRNRKLFLKQVSVRSKSVLNRKVLTILCLSSSSADSETVQRKSVVSLWFHASLNSWAIMFQKCSNNFWVEPKFFWLASWVESNIVHNHQNFKIKSYVPTYTFTESPGWESISFRSSWFHYNLHIFFVTKIVFNYAIHALLTCFGQIYVDKWLRIEAWS